MAIQNGLGIVSYPRRMSRGLEGEIAESQLILGDTYRVPAQGQINTVTIGGVGADTDRVIVLITLPDGTVVTGADTTRTGGAPADDTAMAAALATQINANASLNNHVQATSAAAVLTLTFRHPNTVYTVATQLTGTTGVVAQTQAPSGVAVTPGRFVAAGTSIGGIPSVQALANADDETAVRGIVVREHGGLNQGAVLSTAIDQVQPPALVSVAYQGKVLMRNNGTVAAAKGGAVFVVVNSAGGQERGMARADDDGANAIQMSLSRAYWADATPAGALGAIMLRC